MRKLTLILAVLSVTVFAVAGCGGDEEAASGAVELVPAGAVVYAEATLDPEGDQEEAIRSILAKFPGGGNAGDKLKELIEKGLRESDAPITYRDDIEPWLGDEAALFVSGSQNGQLQAAAGLIATDDEEAAQDALDKSAEGETKGQTYKDVEYMVDESGDAGAVFDGFVVLGTEAGVKAAIDASNGDSKLSDDERYQDTIDAASEDRLGFLYVNMPELARFARESGAGTFPESFQKFFKEPFVATADADEDGVTFEATIPEEVARTFAFLGQGSDLLDELPADSWLALAQSDLGAALDYYVEAFAGVAGGRDAIEQQFRAATGLDLEQDVLSWMGDFAVFVRGSTVPELGGALLVETSDEAKSARFLDAIERLARTQAESGIRITPREGGFTVSIPNVPQGIHAFQANGRVIFAYGDGAAEDAAGGGGGATLGSDDDFTAARDSLGDYEVSFYVLLQPIFDLVDSTGAADDADWQDAKPYLEPLRALISGTSGDGDDLTSAFKIVVK
jgi:hypothetical protein